jgi:hypothetical protein
VVGSATVVVADMSTCDVVTYHPRPYIGSRWTVCPATCLFLVSQALTIQTYYEGCSCHAFDLRLVFD